MQSFLLCGGFARSDFARPSHPTIFSHFPACFRTIVHAIRIRKRMNTRKRTQNQSAYGGTLLKTRAGRARPRPLHFKHTMHLVLRSSQARGVWSFKRTQNEKKIRTIIKKFAGKHRVQILTMAVVGNHLHLQIKLATTHGYKAFIRALTGTIAMAITGASRWRARKEKQKFWDHRPFTRIVFGLSDFKNVRNYLQVNQLEGHGLTKVAARFMQEWHANTS